MKPNKTGRGAAPRGLEGEPRDSYLPKVRCSRTEVELVRWAAEAQNESLANFIRDAVFVAVAKLQRESRAKTG